MAIFDALTFNPQGYGGQGGGLLDLLRSFQMQQQVQPSAGFADQPTRMVPVGDYQMPQFGNPDPAQLPANAAPTQGALPQQQPSPDFGNRLSAGIEGFTAGPGMISKLSGLAQGLSTGQSPTNVTQQALIQRGLDPAIAQQVARNPDLLRAVLPSLMGTAGQTDDIKEYQFAKREDPSLTFDKFMARKRSVTGEHGLNLVFGTGPNGETVAFQPSKSGGLTEAKLPPGFKLSSGTDKVDAGTHFNIYDKRTGTLIGTMPKNVQEKEAAEARGKIQGEAQAELPAVQITADRTIKQIDDFEKSTGFNEVFGLVDQFRPNFTMSDAGRKSLTQFKQLEGRAFLEGRAMLKGGGAITDFESNKAEAAIARLGRSQSEADAKEALQEFKDAVREGVAKLRAKAGGGMPTTAPAATTAPPQRIRLNADGTIAQ